MKKGYTEASWRRSGKKTLRTVKKKKKNCLNIVSQLYFNKIYILRKKVLNLPTAALYKALILGQCMHSVLYL